MTSGSVDRFLTEQAVDAAHFRSAADVRDLDLTICLLGVYKCNFIFDTNVLVSEASPYFKVAIAQRDVWSRAGFVKILDVLVTRGFKA